MTRIAPPPKRVRHLLRGSEPGITLGPSLLLAAWLGTVAGMFQLLPHVAPYLTTRDPQAAASYNAIWLTPLAGAISFVLALLLVATVVRAFGGRLQLDPLVFVLSFLTWLTLVAEPAFRLNVIAAAVLALGLAVQSTALVRKHAPAVFRLARWSLPAFAFLIVLGGVLERGSTSWRARSALAKLGPAAPGSPNVVLLILDTVRADALSLYGYERQTTPNIDAWAGSGAVFSNAFSTSPWTLPAHASMFTGQWPDRLSTDFHVPLDDQWPTVAEVFAEHGYATSAFVANWTYGRRVTGLNRGFAHYDDAEVSVKSLFATFRWSRALFVEVRKLWGNHRSPRRRNAAIITDAFLDWLEYRPDRPFFAFLNYFDAHHPYELQPSFETKFAATPPRYWLQTGAERDITDQDGQELRDAYDSALAFLDQEIGRLRQELDRRGVLENTLVIITSDHGEHFGENGLYTHANSLYAPLLHVPLVLVLPGTIPGGTVIDQPVSVRDLAATMSGMIPAGTTKFPGHTLLRYLHARPRTDAMLQAELRPNDMADENDPISRGMMRSLIRGRYHFIQNGDGSVELYDYVKDPLEQKNLADHASRADLIRSFRASVDSPVGLGSG